MNRKWLWQANLILKITCADKEHLLKTFNNRNISLYDIRNVDNLTFLTTVTCTDYAALCQIAEKCGASVKIHKKSGAIWPVISILNRPVLIIFFMVLILSSWIISNRILFITVEGNTEIAEKYILETAENCGLRFGAIRRNIRSEAIKNSLLEKVPQLQWVGVNTKGCVATISVREKTEIKTNDGNNKMVCSIIALRDGIIQQCTVYRGNALCKVGQAVKAGQILVSGYVASENTVNATCADGEISAITYRKISIHSPKPTVVRGEIMNIKTNYTLKIGKNAIKLWKDSGNLGVTCGKIYSEKYLYLPGGFRLPVSIIKETNYIYDHADSSDDNAEDAYWLEEWAKSYLRSVMIAGKILSSQTTIKSNSDSNTLSGAYTCLEMIGQIKYEQTMLRDVNND